MKKKILALSIFLFLFASCNNATVNPPSNEGDTPGDVLPGDDIDPNIPDDSQDDSGNENQEEDDDGIDGPIIII